MFLLPAATPGVVLIVAFPFFLHPLRLRLDPPGPSGGLRKGGGQEMSPFINADRTWHPFPLGMLGIKTETRFSGYSMLILYV